MNLTLCSKPFRKVWRTHEVKKTIENNKLPDNYTIDKVKVKHIETRTTTPTTQKKNINRI